MFVCTCHMFLISFLFEQLSNLQISRSFLSRLSKMFYIPNLIIGASLLICTLRAQDPFTGYSCPDSCRLPDCRCASRNPPIANPPQFLLLTYDDAIQEAIWAPATNIFRNRRNPNGCAAQATFYAQVEYSDPYLLTQWYAMGNEVYEVFCCKNV